MKRLTYLNHHFKDGYLISFSFFIFCLCFNFSAYSEVLCSKEKRALLEARKEYKLLEKKKKQAESDKKLLERFIESGKKRAIEISNEKFKAQKVLDDIYYKIDNPKSVKAYIEWKRAVNESDKASKVLKNTEEYEIYEKTKEVAYERAKDIIYENTVEWKAYKKAKAVYRNSVGYKAWKKANTAYMKAYKVARNTAEYKDYEKTKAVYENTVEWKAYKKAKVAYMKAYKVARNTAEWQTYINIRVAYEKADSPYENTAEGKAYDKARVAYLQATTNYRKADPMKKLKHLYESTVEWKAYKKVKISYENTAEYKAYKKAEAAYKIAGDKWENGANFFKKLFYFLIYPHWTYLFIQSYKKHNELESRWKERVSELKKLESKLFMHPANPHPITGIPSVDMDINHSRSKIKEALESLTFCKKTESL